MPSDTMRARVLYYFARCQPGPRRLEWDSLRKLLELEEGEPQRFSLLRALRELPDDVKFDLQGDALTLEFAPAGARKKPTPGASRAEDVRRIFEYWRSKTGRNNRTVLDNDRVKIINSRMEEGWTAEEMMLAVDGLMLDPFWTGQNDRGTAYTGIEHVFKNAARIERLIEVARRGDAAGQNSTRTNRATSATRSRAARRRTAPGDQ